MMDRFRCNDDMLFFSEAEFKLFLTQNIHKYRYKNSSNRHDGLILLQWWYRYPNFREAVFKLYSKVTWHLVPYCQWFTLHKCGATLHWRPIPLNFVEKSKKSLKRKKRFMVNKYFFFQIALFENFKDEKISDFKTVSVSQSKNLLV